MSGTRALVDDVLRPLAGLAVVFTAVACHSGSSGSAAPAASSAPAAAPPAADPAEPPTLESATLPLIRAKSGREMLLPLYFTASDELLAKLSPVHVLFDTGSSGLRVLASAVPPALVKRTGKRNKHVYLGTGVVFEGEEALAKLRVGSDPHHLIEMDVAVDLIDLVGCAPEKRDCWGKDGATGMQKLGYAGILGVGTRAAAPGSDTFNPFAQLPANYASGYVVSVAGQAVIVGLTPDVSQGFRRFKLAQDPSRPTLPTGAPAWDDAKLPVCFSFPTVTKTPECAPTLLGSGRSSIVWNTSTVPKSIVQGIHLRDGTTVKVELADVFTWTTGLARDETEVGNGADVATVSRVLGLPFFRDHDVLVDLAHGEIGIRDAAPGGR